MVAAPDSPGRELLAFVHGLSLNEIPVDVVEKSQVCLLEAVGCGVFGSAQPWSRILAEEMQAEGSSGFSTVMGQQTLLSAPAAALCNGTAIHGFELDDLIAESITHPAACIIPSALAAAESCNASGARFLEAIIAGYETMHRIGLALGVEPAKRGFHMTSLVAPVACAVAVGKVMGLTREQLFSAVGLACSSAAGIKSFAAGHGGGMVKRLHLGCSAEAGVRMAQLAGRDFLGPPYAIDSKFGLLEVFGGAGANPSRLVRDLGQTWAMREVWFKYYPICGWIQSAVMLLVQSRGGRPLKPQEIKSVRVGVSEYAARNNGEPAPVDTMGAQYSIPYCAAVALTGEPRDPTSFLPTAIQNPETRNLAERVQIVVDPAIEAAYPGKFGASIKLELTGGAVHEKTVMDCHGTPADPCTRQEHLDKFRWLTGGRLSAETSNEVIRLVDATPTLPGIRTLTALLRPDGGQLRKERAI